jgi:diaminopimelate epimerase
MATRFYKYHALGNDYLVINPLELAEDLDSFRIQRICHRNYGVGSDGILLGPLETRESDFGLRIFNPDGSEAEKSGNGLRIFSRYLWDQGLVREKAFTVMTPGGKVESVVKDGGRTVTVQMGQASFDSTRIPVRGEPREVLNETMTVGGEVLQFCAATVGNPHCVVLRERVSEEEAKRLGPLIEKDSRFPNRTNVQFMKVLDRSHIQIEIWERGAGYTLASGSSSSAAAAVAHRLGLCGEKITVRMPGGELDIRISEDFSVQMTGPVTKIAEGTLSPEMFGS